MGAFAVRGYFDESGDDGAQYNALALCGYVCTIDGWKAFEKEWARVLSENGAPYLHMKELNNHTGPLSQFAGAENYERQGKLLSDLVTIIAKSGLIPIPTD